MATRHAFFVSPIGPETSPERKHADEVLRYIVEPVLADFDYEVMRADHDPHPGPITSKVIEELLSADLVLADLTGPNANVYYEVAVAHCFGRRIIIFVDDPKRLGFDLKDERAIPLGPPPLTADNEHEATKQLRETLKVVSAEGYKPTNVVTVAQTLLRLKTADSDEDPVAVALAEVRRDHDRLADQVDAVARVVAANLKRREPALTTGSVVVSNAPSTAWSLPPTLAGYDLTSWVPADTYYLSPPTGPLHDTISFSTGSSEPAQTGRLRNTISFSTGSPEPAQEVSGPAEEANTPPRRRARQRGVRRPK
jgi:hypothetical protein